MSVTTPAALCRGFGYPEVVREILEKVVDAARRHLEPLGLRSVQVGGSVARGEVTWLDTPSGVELLSDIDGALVTERRDPEREGALRAEMVALAETHARSPLFFVDAGVHRPYMKRHTVWTYEMRRSAVTLHGEDVRWLLPRVTAKSLDLGSTAQLVLVRMWSQLVFTPLGVVRGDPTPHERLIFSYVTARNILDLPTILLPHHGVLLGGYAARDAWLRSNPPLAVGFGADFVALCHEALAMKRAPAAGGARAPRLAKMLAAYGRLMAHVARLADPSAPPDPEVRPTDARFDRALSVAFREHPLMLVRRLALETALRLRYLRAGERGVARGYDYVRATRFQMALLRALAVRLDGNSGEAALADAVRVASDLGRRAEPAEERRPWADRWQALREWFIRLHGGVLYKGNAKKIAQNIATARWRG